MILKCRGVMWSYYLFVSENLSVCKDLSQLHLRYDLVGMHIFFRRDLFQVKHIDSRLPSDIFSIENSQLVASFNAQSGMLKVLTVLS
jgi:hypothetical protein